MMAVLEVGITAIFVHVLRGSQSFWRADDDAQHAQSSSVRVFMVGVDRQERGDGDETTTRREFYWRNLLVCWALAKSR